MKARLQCDGGILIMKRIDYLKVEVLQRSFILSCIALLLLSAFAKLYSSFGDAKLLYQLEPLTQIQYRPLLQIVGLIESVAALLILVAKSLQLKYLTVIFLSANFLLYRLMYFVFGIPKAYCPCLGSLTEQLKLDPGFADLALEGIAIYLFAGSLIGLLASHENAKLGVASVGNQMGTG